MNGIKYLLDTNILIGLFTNHPETLQLFQEKPLITQECAISTISRIELLSFHHLTSTEEHLLKDKLLSFKVLKINDPIEEKTIELRKKLKLKIPDAIIVATAIVHQLQLMTLDKKLKNKLSCASKHSVKLNKTNS